MIEGGVVITTIQPHRLLTEARIILQPELHVLQIERLRKHIVRINTGLHILIDHLLSIVLLGIVTLVGHDDAGRLQLRGELDANTLEQIDALGMAEHRALPRVDVATPAHRRIQILRHRAGIRIGGIHLALQGLEFRQADVTGAALGRGRPHGLPGDRINHRRRKGLRALGGQIRSRMLVVWCRSHCEWRQTSSRS